MTTGRINQVSTSARAPSPLCTEAQQEPSAAGCPRAQERNRELTNASPREAKRPNCGLDHSSPDETAPADGLIEMNPDRSTAAFGARVQKDSRASTPAAIGDVPLDTHTSSLSMTRAEQADDGHDETPRTRRTAQHDRTRTAPRPRGKRQWNAESRAHGRSSHSATTQPVRGLPRSSWFAAAG